MAPPPVFPGVLGANDVSFEVQKGETVGIIGRNGSGKSTLLQLIAGTLTRTTGSVHVNGRIAALLELGSGFNPEFTGRENVYVNGSILGLTRQEIEDRFEAIATFAEIGDFMDQPVKTYSSGMFPRLAFAVASNVDPEILIVDEALAVGDARFQLKCFLKFQELQERHTTIFFVSHDVNTVKRYCSRVIPLEGGHVVFQGDANTAVNHYIRILFPEGTTALEPELIKTITRGEHPPVITSTREYRYGSREGEIAAIALYNSNGRPTTVFTSGERMILAFRAIVKRHIEKPILAMVIKDPKGQDIYGTNTDFKGIHMPQLTPGSEIEVSFTQDLHLIPNTYFVSLRFLHIDNGNIVPMDCRYDVLEITVVAKEGDLSIGIADLHSEIR